MIRLMTSLILLVALAGWMTVQAHGQDEPPAVDGAPVEVNEEAVSDSDEAESVPAADAESSDEHADEEHGDAEPHGEAGHDHGEAHGHGDEHGDEHAVHTPDTAIEKHDADKDGKLDHSELSVMLGEMHKVAHDAAHDIHEEEAGVSPLPFDPDLAIFTVIVFVILLLVLGKFAWGPIMEGLDKREGSVAENIEQARENNEKAAALLVEYEERLAAASAEAKEMVEEARRDSETTRERIVAEATEAATQEKDRALQAIQLAKEAALHDMTKRSVEQAVALAKGIVRRELNPEDHAQLIQETLDQFPSRN